MVERRAQSRDERGFTLVELMVVVLIIAVLIAIAIPTFLGARQTAQARAVQANVRNAFTATRVYYNDRQTYTSSPTAMATVEPSLQWTTTPLDATSPDRAIYISVWNSNQIVVVVGRTKDGRCYYLKDEMGGLNAGTYYDRQVPSGASCPDPTTLPTWNNAWSN